MAKVRPLRPLRRVVDHFLNEYGAEVEKLECGHTLHRKQDHMGPTNANRRRCRYCVAVASASVRGRSA